jgi:carboxyl-terminal processing protease
MEPMLEPFLPIDEFFVPSHLNRLELAFVGLCRIVLKVRQSRNPFMEIGEADSQRIDIGMRLHQRERNVFGIFPAQSRHQNYGNGFTCYPAGEYVLAYRLIAIFVLAAGFCAPSAAQQTPKQKADNLESFETVWRTVRDRHPDPKLNGLDWQAIHDSTRPAIEKAQSMQEVRRLLTEMLDKLEASHYAIIPRELYNEIGNSAAAEKQGSPGIVPVIIGGKAVVGSVEAGSPAAQAGIRPGMVLDAVDGAKLTQTLRLLDDLKDPESPRIVEQSVSNKLSGPLDQAISLDVIDEQGHSKHVEFGRTAPKGTLVHFGNLPETRLYFESRALADGAGYIHFNEFLDPASIMPQIETALKDFHNAPGVILDLRGNPGGIGIMAMGIAGFFIDKDGQKLGEMKMRDVTLKFVIFPRPETYAGPLAILVDEGSASTSEILAGGLQDLKRARIFGVRTAGAALPSDIIRLPNGDGFQYAQASYTSESGKVLEGEGVTPDVVVRQTREALLAGRDPVVEAADEWIRSKK